MPKSDICPLSKAASISVTTLKTAVLVEKTKKTKIQQFTKQRDFSFHLKLSCSNSQCESGRVGSSKY